MTIIRSDDRTQPLVTVVKTIYHGNYVIATDNIAPQFLLSTDGYEKLHSTIEKCVQVIDQI